MLSYIRKHSVVVSVIAIVAIVLAIIAERAGSAAPAQVAAPALKSVTLVSASLFRNGTSTVSASGIVQAHDQADLKSQVGAPVASIDSAIGDTVYAGQAIMELQNNDLRAQLESAQASLSLAQGTYGSTRQGAVDKVRDAYFAADSAVHTTLDPLILTSLGTTPPLFAYYLTDPMLGNQIKDTRTSLTKAFVDWKASLDSLSASSTDAQVHAAITLSETNLDTTLALLDQVSQALNKSASVALSSSLATISGLQTSVSAARTAVSGAKSGLTSADSSLSGQTSGGSAASAQITIAQSGVKNLQAQLAKTIITSPISGKISALPLRVGEFAAPGQLLATVVGSGGLQVKAYVSGEDFTRIQPGSAAIIQGSVIGTVSNVAPSVSADTKRAEVDIDINNSAASGLAVGQNVQAAIQAKPQSEASGGSSDAGANGTVEYMLPIQDIKIVPGSAYVLTVGADSKIKTSPVTLGPVSGDFIQVVSGLTDDMNIVSPVYELEEGQSVTVLQ